MVVRVLRSVAACALPRPSATASATFAKNTVSHSQTAMPHVKPNGSDASPPPRNGSVSAMTVVRAAPTHTRNITGLRHCDAGWSFFAAPGRAATICAALNARRGAAEVGASAGAGASVSVDIIE